MVVRDWLAAMLNDLVNCKNAGKKETVIMPISNLMIEILKIMKQHGYIKEFEIKEDKFPYMVIKIGKLNKAGAIKPRFFVKKNGYEKYVKRFLPSRNIGILIVSTNKGVMTHKEAMEKNLGGCLLAYCY